MSIEITGFLGDSREILPSIASNSVELVLTDPLYNYNEDEKRWFHREFVRISRGAVIVFSPIENLWRPAEEATQTIFWEKPTSTKNTSCSYSRFVEIIQVFEHVKPDEESGKLRRWNTNLHWSNYVNIVRDVVDDREHPWRKPYSLIERLVRIHSDEGDTILDPFAGSGVVAEVSKNRGRHCIFIEQDETYFDLCKKNVESNHWTNYYYYTNSEREGEKHEN